MAPRLRELTSETAFVWMCFEIGQQGKQNGNRPVGVHYANRTGQQPPEDPVTVQIPQGAPGEAVLPPRWQHCWPVATLLLPRHCAFHFYL